MTSYTEQEARKRWCPFARDCQENGGNRMAYGGDVTEPIAGDLEQFAAEMADMHPCIASACMAWRWDELAGDTDKHGKVTFRNCDRGYCGLAGKAKP